MFLLNIPKQHDQTCLGLPKEEEEKTGITLLLWEPYLVPLPFTKHRELHSSTLLRIVESFVGFAEAINNPLLLMITPYVHHSDPKKLASI